MKKSTIAVGAIGASEIHEVHECVADPLLSTHLEKNQPVHGVERPVFMDLFRPRRPPDRAGRRTTRATTSRFAFFRQHIPTNRSAPGRTRCEGEWSGYDPIRS
jgi:hypothetical protein